MKLAAYLIVGIMAVTHLAAAQSGFNASESTSIGGNTGFDTMWADSTAHRWLMTNNGPSTVRLVTAWPCTSGGCIPFSAATSTGGYYLETGLTFPVSSTGPGLPLISGTGLPQWGGGTGPNSTQTFALDLQTGNTGSCCALALASEVTNDSGGTTINKLAKLNAPASGAATALKIGTGDYAIPSYIVVTGAGTSNNAQLALDGEALCVMDASTSNTAGLFVIASTSTAGDCSTTATPTFGTWIVGQMISSSTTINNTSLVLVHPGYRALGAITGLSYSSGTTLATASGPVSGDLASWDSNNNVTDSTIATSNVVTASSTLTASRPVVGNGSKTIALGTSSGNTTQFANYSGSPSSTTNLTSWDGSGGVKDSGIATTSAALLVTAACTGAVGTGNGTTYPLVPYATQGGTSCSQTGSTQEMPIPATCTGKSLYVTASAAGATAGSGVVTVYYDGNIPSSGPACTLGISTTCNDLTHTVAMSAGHTYSVRVKTGQASDTTANVRASFICQ